MVEEKDRQLQEFNAIERPSPSSTSESTNAA
jgi:hypothetical protein